ncbi:zinc finger MYM-type protein 1-like protein, partial [Tanacetum coccineum]
MAIILRYVNKSGLVKAKLVGFVHLKETSSSYRKDSIDSLFVNHNLSLKQLRGQCYDGASNICGEFNGLKAKILEENNSAYYVHCFAHQLQLVVVAVARKHLGVVNFFDKLALMTYVVCASCKRKYILIDFEKERVEKTIGNGEVETERGKNQELSLIRAGDTRWNSHYKTIFRLIDLLPSVIKVLEFVENEGSDGSRQNQSS